MIKPNEIPNEFQRKQLDEAEKVVDSFLIKNYNHKALYVGQITNLTHELTFMLWERYRKAGWNVYFDCDTVDGLPSGPWFAPMPENK